MSLLTEIKAKALDPLLRRAAKSLKDKESFSSLYLSDFENTHQLADFIGKSTDQFRNRDYSSGERLWDIFAPTCEWDDIGGSQNLSNPVLALLDPEFRPNRNPK